MITQELIRQAKDVDIISFLERYGYTFKRKGKRYICTQHDSLIFSIAPNSCQVFVWNSKCNEGDSIKFVMDYITDGNFKKAISLLTNSNLDEKKLYEASSQTLSKALDKIEYAKNMKRTFAYLIKTRLISSSIIQKLVKDNMIAQDKHNNIVFKWLNNNEFLGADLVGTLTDIRFKSTVQGSNEDYGFSICLNKKPEMLLVFESPIDLLSFYTLNMNNKNLGKMLLLSLSGCEKIYKIQTYLNLYPSIEKIYSCLDNDNAGNIATQKITNTYSNIKVFDGRKKLKENNVKDWNQLLINNKSNEVAK